MKLKSLAFAALAVAAVSANAATSTGLTVAYAGHEYTLLTADDWLASEAYAVSQGAHLVVIDDAAENAFVNTTFGFDKTIWLGLARTAAIPVDSFAWVDGSTSTYRNWAGGEPNNAGGNENYVHTYTNGTWNDLPSSSGYAAPQYGVMEVAAVPEPETYALMLGGLAAMAMVVRRRRPDAR